MTDHFVDRRPRNTAGDLIADGRPREASGELMSFKAIQDMVSYYQDRAKHYLRWAEDPDSLRPEDDSRQAEEDLEQLLEWQKTLDKEVEAAETDPERIEDDRSISDFEDYQSEDFDLDGAEGEGAAEEQGVEEEAAAAAEPHDPATPHAELLSPADGYDPMWYQIAVDEGRDLPDPYSFRSKIKFDDMFKQGVFHPHDQLETVVEYEEDGENKNTVVVVEFLKIEKYQDTGMAPLFRITTEDTDLDETVHNITGIRCLIEWIKGEGFEAQHLSQGKFAYGLRVTRGQLDLGSFQSFKNVYHLYQEEQPQEWWRNRRGKGDFKRMRTPMNLLQQDKEGRTRQVVERYAEEQRQLREERAAGAQGQQGHDEEERRVEDEPGDED